MTSTPGATTSGLILPNADGPRPEKPAMLSLMSVGARIHWPDDRSSSSGQPSGSQPLAAIQRAPGATPTSGVNGPGPSPPTIVPIVWVPWPTLSHGSPPQTLLMSHQL